MTNEQRLPTEAETSAWMHEVNNVTERMRKHTRPFIVPLSIETDREVRQVGTGSFLQVTDEKLIITCRHVANEGQLNYSFIGSSNVYQAPPFGTSAEIDVAAVTIPNSQWSACLHSAAYIAEGRIGKEHKPDCGHEVFFFHGFAGENSHFGFKVLESAATAYSTQIAEGAPSDPNIFELLWEPEQTKMVASTTENVSKATRLSNAGGLSGSLVWNTRYLETKRRGKPWSPDLAVVSGLLKRWDTSTKTLLVIRIEHVNAWLKDIFLGKPKSPSDKLPCKLT